MGLVPRRSYSPPLLKRSPYLAAQTGWLVKGRVASLYARAAILIFFEVTNHPVCAAKERDLFVKGASTPPFKGGECCSPHNPFMRQKSRS